MTRPRALVASVGCKLNQAEADLWKAYLVRQGYQLADDTEESVNDVELCLVTTCTVTEPADRSSVALIRRLHRTYPNAEIKVAGCGPEVKAERLAGLEGVKELMSYHDKEVILAELDFADGDLIPAISRSRAFLRVADGCDRRCTYCIVSRIRGKPRSKPATEIVNELVALSDTGFSEVVLVALNLGLWGIERGKSLAFLLREIDKLLIRTRIRLTSLEPDTITPELLDVIAGSKRIFPHLHVPLQSGSDKVLNDMARPYRTGDFKKQVEDIAERIPDVCIGTDIITSTPGEDEESFEETTEFVRNLPLAYLHAFTYSPRPGTPMAEEKSRIKNPRKRTALLRKLGAQKSLAYRNRFVGKTREAVVLSPTRVLTDNYIDVTMSETNMPQRSFVNVKITGVSTEKTFGELVNSRVREEDLGEA